MLNSTTIILINPKMPSSAWFNSQASGISPPLGLLSIASYLKKNSIDAVIIDDAAENLTIDEVLTKIERINPILIGITVNTPVYPYVKKLINSIKSKFNLPIVVGGHHPSALPEYTLNDSKADYVISGYGEKTLLQLIESLKKGAVISNIRGLSYRLGDKIIVNKEENLDLEICRLKYDYSLLPINKYRPSLSRRLTDGNFCAIITSRGCTYKCRFCSKLDNDRYLLRDINVIREEVEELKASYNIRELIVWDDNFTLNPERAIEIAKIMNKYDIVWSCYSRVDLKDYGILYKLRKLGLRQITFGCESADEKSLKESDKRITLENIREAIKYAKSYNILTFASVILGFPNDDMNSIKRTIDFFIDLDPDYVAFSVLIPYPGSFYFNYSVENNLIDISTTDWESYINIFSSKLPPCSLCKLSREELIRLQKYALRRFFFRKKYIMRNLNYIVEEGFFRLRSTWKGLKTILLHQLHRI